ncbi:MAG TPA: cupredoxin domain-containing protein [Candidatus Limnocylindria bacterium]|jgi:plastocyanin
MTFRWYAIRALACLALLATAACGAAEAPRAVRPNEVQVFEPTGEPDKWTYAPNTIGVAKGTTVTFVNRGKEFHTVTSDDAGRPFDLSIDTNQTGTITFDKIGTFAYHCGVHPQMKGVVRVCDGACT